MAEPTHIVAAAGDQRSLCGIKDPLPRVAAVHVAAHVEGHRMVVCPACTGSSHDRSRPHTPHDEEGDT